MVIIRMCKNDIHIFWFVFLQNKAFNLKNVPTTFNVSIYLQLNVTNVYIRIFEVPNVYDDIQMD